MEVVFLKDITKVEYKEKLSVCLGFFDALHLGHLELIKKAKEFDLPVGLVTFSSNPLELIKSAQCSIVNNLEMKKEILESLCIDYLFVLDLSWDILNLSKEKFIDDILVKIGAKNVICGFDYSFGQRGQGNPDFLKEYGKDRFNVHIIQQVVNDNNEKISSTLVHKLIKEGKIEEVNQYLTRPYQIRGKVKKGYQIGRTIDYKTANIELDEPFELPSNGVYATRIVIDSKTYDSMTNIGVHPTVNRLEKPLIETNIFDFVGDIYSKNVKLYFYKKTREEQKFSSLKDLKNQLIQDEKEICNYFKNKKDFTCTK